MAYAVMRAPLSAGEAVRDFVVEAEYETLLQKMQREGGAVQTPKPEAVPEKKSSSPDVTQDQIRGLYEQHALEADNTAPDGEAGEPVVLQDAGVEAPADLPVEEDHDPAVQPALTVNTVEDIVRQAVPAGDKPVYGGYILGPGDKLKVTVFGEEDLSGIFAVNDAGQISFPLVGEVDVHHLKVLEARDRISALLAAGYLKEPNIAIEVVEFRPFYIMGEVRAPGSYTYVADMTVLNAVAMAGGFTYRADQDDVEIIREGKDKPVHYDDLPSGTKVVPGDIIIIDERFF